MSKKQIAQLAFRLLWMVIPLMIFVSVNDFILHWSAFQMILVYIGFGLIAGLAGFVGPFKRYQPISAGIYLFILLTSLAMVHFYPSAEAENGGKNISALMTLCFILWYSMPRFAILYEQTLQANNPQQSFDFKDDETT